MADSRQDPSRTGPSLPDIQRALDEQYTDTVRDQAHRFAEKRASLVRRAGRPIPRNYAAELVHDAMTSIWLGVRRWDPHKMPLVIRLWSIIKDRTWREIRQTKRHQHVSFDLAANDASLDADVQEALSTAESTDEGPTLEMVVLVHRVVDALRDLGRGDDDARAILGCWDHGFLESDDVITLTGLSEPAFRAARQRILRLAKRLPPDLREAALDLLRSAS